MIAVKVPAARQIDGGSALDRHTVRWICEAPAKGSVCGDSGAVVLIKANESPALTESRVSVDYVVRYPILRNITNREENGPDDLARLTARL
jgi:hypothetical protein